MVTNINPNEFLIIFWLGLPLVVIRNYAADSFHSYKSTDMQKYYIPLLKNHKIITLHSNNSYSEHQYHLPVEDLVRFEVVYTMTISKVIFWGSFVSKKFRICYT